jgi:hypothetical protein
MSIFNLGRQEPAIAQPVYPDRTTWWNWNPARRPVLVERTAPPPAEPWWRWNPYRRPAVRLSAVDRHQGYAEGRREERRILSGRARRRSHPLLTLVVFLAAASSVGFVGLAFEAGSFEGAGAIVDNQIAQWRGDVVAAADRAGTQGGQTVQSVGRQPGG